MLRMFRFQKVEQRLISMFEVFVPNKIKCKMRMRIIDLNLMKTSIKINSKKKMNMSSNETNIFREILLGHLFSNKGRELEVLFCRNLLLIGLLQFG